MANCASCSGPQICLSCVNGYYLASNKTKCGKCKDPKFTCGSFDTDYNGCMNAPSEYFYNNNCYKCSISIDNCIECYNSSGVT